MFDEASGQVAAVEERAAADEQGFSELKMAMNISCPKCFPGRVPNGCDQQGDVAVIEAGDRVAQIDGGAAGEAG